MQEFLQHLHNDLIVKIIPLAGGIPLQLVYAGGLLVASVLVIVWMSLIAMGWIYLERKVAGYMQARVGPNRVHIRWGPLKILPPGWLQSLADGIKLLSKEDIVPAAANRVLYELAPLLVFAGAFIPFAALPFSQHIVVADMDLGLFFIMAFGALEVVGILMAGWAPNSKWTLYGGMRLAAQMLAYEIPLGLSVLVVVVLAGTLNLTDIVLWQTKGFLLWDNVNTPWLFDFLNWSIFRAPLAALPAFLIFYIAGLAETKRAPFDLPEAESELVAGFHTEYTGIRFSYFFLAEYCSMYVIAVLGSVVFLGGWHFPFPTVYDAGDAGIIPAIAAGVTERIHWMALPTEGGVFAMAPAIWANVKEGLKLALLVGPAETLTALSQPAAMKVIFNELFGFLNLIGKAFFLLFVMLWIRWTLPRIRIDQVMRMCLKVMLPISLACVLLAAIQGAFTGAEGFTPRSAAVTSGAGSAAAVKAAEGEEGAAEGEAAAEPEAASGDAKPAASAESEEPAAETAEESH